MKEYNIVIVGGGSAGLAAAYAAASQGCSDILLLERDKELGGILQQCIHNGFGLHRFKEELSGPAYAEKWIDMLASTDVTVKTDTMVIHLGEDKSITYVNRKEGYVTIKAKAIVLAMGCRERTRGAIAIPGYRPSGIWTAGTAQRYLNMEGYMVGKKIFILGSGDIGLIMARRMTLEGAKVLGVAELMPYSNGLPRNMKQCLEDFKIPLFLSHTVTNIRGKERLEGITITKVDDKLTPIPGTEKEFEVDTLLLSVGLIPENTLSEEAGIVLHKKTKGPVVDESLQTSMPGVFACGNSLHVHDLVDFVSMEGERAGTRAAQYILSDGAVTKEENTIPVSAGENVSYVLPTLIHTEKVTDSMELMFRVTANIKNVNIEVKYGEKTIKTIKKPHVAPSEMEKVALKKSEIDEMNLSEDGELTISIKPV